MRRADTDRQGLLPFPATERSAAEIADRLGMQLEREVSVQFGRSRSTPVHVRPDTEPTLRIRLHGFFRRAPDEVLDALARWLCTGRRARRACARLDAWIEARVEELPAPAPRRLDTAGVHHDLARLAAAVRAYHLPDLGDAEPLVTWGQRRASKGVSSLQLGSFDPTTRLVRIHPVLDAADVPEYFVRFVLHHEFLHAVIPSEEHGGRTDHHPPAFRRREQSHPDFARATAWEARNLPRLIRRARTLTARS